MTRWMQLRIKCAFDIGVSSIALIVLSPLIGLIAVAVKLGDGGPVLFVQDRVGKDGRIFRCHKFRTMVVGAEKEGPGLEVTIEDPRLTRVGRWLRYWTLDELPQLFDVVRGEMSLVGPRPTVVSQVARYTRHQRRRLEMKPGMAGWAWIHGRNRLPWSKRIELDVWYVNHWSLWLDLRILFKAVLLLFRHEGVYGQNGTVRDLE